MKFLKNIILAMFFILSGSCSFAQKQINGTVANAVREMAENNIYETSCNVGFAGSVSSQYQRFKLLLSSATPAQLIALATNNKNPIVRLYAFQALKKRNINTSNSLIEKFKNDHTEVNKLNGCLGEKTTVNLLTAEIFISPASGELIKEQ